MKQKQSFFLILLKDYKTLKIKSLDAECYYSLKLTFKSTYDKYFNKQSTYNEKQPITTNTIKSIHKYMLYNNK